jgi:hypothetical protein
LASIKRRSGENANSTACNGQLPIDGFSGCASFFCQEFCPPSASLSSPFLSGSAICNVSLPPIVHFLTPEAQVVVQQAVLTVFFDWHVF